MEAKPPASLLVLIILDQSAQSGIVSKGERRKVKVTEISGALLLLLFLFLNTGYQMQYRNLSTLDYENYSHY
jgi:hypothetical protein